MSGKMNRKDALIATTLVVIYMILSLFQLGDNQQPQQGWTPKESGIVFHVSFDETVELSRMSYFTGHGKDWYSTGVIQVQYQNQENEWVDLGKLEKSPGDFFKWKFIDMDIATQKIRFTTRSYIDGEGNDLGAKGTFLEIAFFDQLGRNIGIHQIETPDTDVSHLFDEPQYAIYSPNRLNSTYFDEIYFVRTAYEYMHELPIYENTHPPLGKSLIALGMRIFGINPFGWRIMGALTGGAMIFVMYLFAKRLFKKTLWAVFASVFMMAESMLFVQTRMGTVDGFLVLTIFLMFYFMYLFYEKDLGIAHTKEWTPFLLFSGIFFGMALSVKWIGAFGGIGLAFLYFQKGIMTYRKDHLKKPKKQKFDKKHIGWFLGMGAIYFILVPFVIYFLSFIPVFRSEQSVSWWSDFWRYQTNMFNYHSGVTQTHSFASPWWSWPFMIRPVFYYHARDVAQGLRASIASLGNPVIWGGGLIALIGASIQSHKTKDQRIWILLAGYLSIWLPWAFSPRSLTFLYHYFACVPFLILAIVLFFENLVKKNKRFMQVLLAYLATAVVIFVVFYPVLAGIPFDEQYVEGLRLLPSWWF